MNVEAYTLDSLRKLVRELQEENRILRDLLKEKNIEIAGYAAIEKVYKFRNKQMRLQEAA